MKLIELKMSEYLDILFSDAPAPGGGAVSAVAGAQAAAMMGMVANLTIGKKRYEEWQEECLAARAKAEVLFTGFAEAIDKDAEAYSRVAAAYRMPKGTEEEIAARKEAIAESTLGATEVPFSVMKMAEEGIKVVEAMVGRSNPNASSDLGVAALNLVSCMKSAWLNVKINLPSIRDKELAEKYRSEGEAMIRKNEELAEKIYAEVEGNL